MNKPMLRPKLRRRVWLLALILCVLADCLMLASAPALAEKVHVPGPTFGEPCTADPCGPGQFDEPLGVALNDSTSMEDPAAGDVYVVDSGNNRVERFSSDGTYLGQFDGSGTFEVEGKEEHGEPAPTGKFASPEEIAVDDDPLSSSAGDVYVTDAKQKAIDEFGPTGNYIGQFTGTCRSGGCSGTEAFGVILDVTVDPAGNVWVYEENRYVDECSNNGVCEKKFETRLAAGAPGLVVDARADIYVNWGELKGELTSGGSVLSVGIVKFNTATGKELGRLDKYPEGANTFALEPNTGAVYEDRGSYIATFNPFGEPYETGPHEPFGELSESYGLAVSAASTVYASERGADNIKSFDYLPLPTVTTEPASDVTPTGMTLHGTVNPEGEPVSECYFEYGTEAGKYSDREACAQNLVSSQFSGTKGVPVSATIAGLPASDIRSFRLVATNANGRADGQGITISLPGVTGEAISEVGPTAATVGAQVDPDGLETCYRVDYGTSAGFSIRFPEASEECLGAVSEEVGVRLRLNGLQPATRYQFKLVATNALGTTESSDVVFTTVLPTSGLPDGRVYELVSSLAPGQDTEVNVPDTGAGITQEGLDEDVRGIATTRPFQVAPDGAAVVYPGFPPPTGGDGKVGVQKGNEFVATRGPAGWASRDIQLLGRTVAYGAFSQDLSVGILEAGEPLTPGAPAEGYGNLYAHTTVDGVEGEYQPLFAGTPSLAPEDFGWWSFPKADNKTKSAAGIDGIASGYAGANTGTSDVPSFTHRLFAVNDALTSTPEATNGGDHADNLYDSVDGQLRLVNVLPSGKAEPNATFGSIPVATLYREDPSGLDNVISADGSRVFWTAVETKEAGEEFVYRPKALYVRENDAQPQSEVEGEYCTEPGKACTVQIDAAEPECASCASGGGKFWTASSDGSNVFFTDEGRLTGSSTAATGEPDLYEYEVNGKSGEPGTLTDLTVTKTGAHADVQGVVGASEDGSYVYFVADGVLTEGKNLEEKEPVAGQPNLYLHHDGETTYVATLSVEDGDAVKPFELEAEGGAIGDWQAAIGDRTAEVTPNGHDLAFVSNQELTGYHNKNDNVSLDEVFLYEVGSGELRCVSCNPTGEAPVATEFNTHYSDIPLGGFLQISENATEQDQMVSEDEGRARVFFDSGEPLVPQDTNGLLDAYEWEENNAGTCRESQGCIYLLSGGTDPEDSYLIGASADGDDVFFASRADLVAQDRTDDEVVYDAHAGGVQPPEPVVCAGAGCQGVPPAPPIFATPASVTFNGVGNYPPPSSSSTTKKTTKKKTVKCAKGKRLSHGKCVKTKKKTERRRGRKTTKSDRRRK